MNGTSPTYPQLKAVLFNCTLEKDESASHTGLLLEVVADLMRRAEVSVNTIHVASHAIAPGVQPDLRDMGWPDDAWPGLWSTVLAADVIVLGTPLWLGSESSLCRVVIERLYAHSGELNDQGQSVFYGKAGGAVVTGNEDGVKHAAKSLLYSLQHLGCMIPPQADCGWIGPIGPGPSYGDPTDGGEPIGYDTEYTQQTATVMTWNLLHTADLLRRTGGLPTYGNDRNAWAQGQRFGFANPRRSR